MQSGCVTKNLGKITVSIVSHGHGDMVWKLVKQLAVCQEVCQIVVTLNVPESVSSTLDPKVLLIQNQTPKGFGSNHNAAFALASGEFYCVINPDIELSQNPFVELIDALADQRVGLAAPLVVRANGDPEDSMRRFLTPFSMVRRVLGLHSGVYPLRQSESNIEPDWVAGMFMLFRSQTYAEVGGFDERYFMYCEDAEICTRLWKAQCKVVGCLSASVIHNARRASHRSFKHFSWHLQSMARYFLSHSVSLPNKDPVI